MIPGSSRDRFHTHLMHGLLKYVFYILVALAMVGCQTPEPLDCSIFFPPDENSPSLPCVATTNNGFPKTIGPTADLVSIFHFTDKWASDAAHNQVLQSVADAVDKVMPTYATYADFFSINLVIVSTLPTNKAGITQGIPPDAKVCFVRIKYPADAGQLADLPQVVAHELYHCVQGRNNPLITTTPEDLAVEWWVEASAEYFADEYYPQVAAHQNSPIQGYTPGSPLFDQDYSASVFFQYWSNSGAPDDEINIWVSSHVLASTVDDESTQLSEDARITRVFPGFAAAFYSNTIKLSDGTFVGSTEAPLVETWTVDLPADDAISTQTYRIDPWTINVFAATLPASQVITVTLSTSDPHAVLQYRKSDSTTWTSLPNTGDLPQDCSASDPSSYDFILTSTQAPLAKTSGKVIFHRTDSTACNCDTSQNVAFDPCLAGAWLFDTTSLKDAEEAAYQVEGVTVLSLAVTGDSTLNITPPPESTSTLTFSDLTIASTLSVDGIEASTSVDVTGTVTAKFVMQTANKEFCWQNVESKGTAVIVIDGVAQKEIIGEQFGQTGTKVMYTCSADSLLLTGSWGGKTVFQYAYKKA